MSGRKFSLLCKDFELKSKYTVPSRGKVKRPGAKVFLTPQVLVAGLVLLKDLPSSIPPCWRCFFPSQSLTIVTRGSGRREELLLFSEKEAIRQRWRQRGTNWGETSSPLLELSKRQIDTRRDFSVRFLLPGREEGEYAFAGGLTLRKSRSGSAAQVGSDSTAEIPWLSGIP